MGLFGRHSRQGPNPAAPRAGQPGSRLAVAGLAEYAAARGWRASIVDRCAVSVCQVRLGWFLGEPVWIGPARFVSAVPARLLATGDPAGAAAQPVTLSRGTVYDPAHIEDWKAALAAMAPDRQRQLLDELRARLAERRAQRPAR